MLRTSLLATRLGWLESLRLTPSFRGVADAQVESLTVSISKMCGFGKLDNDGEGISYERTGEDNCPPGNLGQRETGFDAHTDISTEARPSFPHRKDRWSHGGHKRAAVPGVFQLASRCRIRIRCSAIHAFRFGNYYAKVRYTAETLRRFNALTI